MKFEGCILELRALINGEFPDEEPDELVQDILKEQGVTDYTRGESCTNKEGTSLIARAHEMGLKAGLQESNNAQTEPYIPGWTYIGVPEWDADGDYEPKEYEMVMRMYVYSASDIYGHPSLVGNNTSSKYYLFRRN